MRKCKQKYFEKESARHGYKMFLLWLFLVLMGKYEAGAGSKNRMESSIHLSQATK